MDFEQIGSACTGLSVSSECFERTATRRAEISAASRQMVERMRRLGVNLIVPVRSEAIGIGNLTGCVGEAWPDQDIVRKTVVPSHAAVIRGAWLKEAEYYLRKHRNGRNARYGVVTCGPRIKFDSENPDEFDRQCEAQLKRARANMAKWRNESRDRYGIEFVMSVLEAAIDDDSVHLHFNVIYIPPRLKGGVWQQWLRWSSSRVGSWWKDCGRINDLREVIKYSTKLLGANSLQSLGDDQFGQLFRLLDGLTTIVAHHGFKDFRKGLEQDKKKVIRLPHNGHLVILDRRKRDPKLKKITPGRDDDRPVENRILTRMVPRPFGSEVIEPVTIVEGYTEAPATEEGRQGLLLIRRQMEQAKEWAGANGYIVHTLQLPIQPSDFGQVADEPPVHHPYASEGLTRPGDAGQRGDSPGVRARPGPIVTIPQRNRIVPPPSRKPMRKMEDGSWRVVVGRHDSRVPAKNRIVSPPARTPMRKMPDGTWRPVLSGDLP